MGKARWIDDGDVLKKSTTKPCAHVSELPRTVKLAPAAPFSRPAHHRKADNASRGVEAMLGWLAPCPRDGLVCSMAVGKGGYGQIAGAVCGGGDTHGHAHEGLLGLNNVSLCHCVGMERRFDTKG